MTGSDWATCVVVLGILIAILAFDQWVTRHHHKITDRPPTEPRSMTGERNVFDPLPDTSTEGDQQ